MDLLEKVKNKPQKLVPQISKLETWGTNFDSVRDPLYNVMSTLGTGTLDLYSQKSWLFIIIQRYEELDVSFLDVSFQRGSFKLEVINLCMTLCGLCNLAMRLSCREGREGR